MLMPPARYANAPTVKSRLGGCYTMLFEQSRRGTEGLQEKRNKNVLIMNKSITTPHSRNGEGIEKKNRASWATLGCFG